MKDSEFSRKDKSATISSIFGLAIVLVAAATIWVGSGCIDIFQKKDAIRYEQSKKELDSSLPDDLQSSKLIRDELEVSLGTEAGSEVLYRKGLAAVEKHQYTEGTECFSEVLKMIPEEAKTRKLWEISGATYPKDRYTAWAFQERASCYSKSGKVNLAISDLTEVIKLRPDYPNVYDYRARAYEKLGRKDLAAADRRTAQAVYLEVESKIHSLGTRP